MNACSNKSILVTGATGFIGRGLCLRMVREGWHVRGAVRTLSDIQRLPSGVEPVPVGTLGPDTRWEPALQGVETVVHLAARTHVTHETEKDPLAAYRATNVAGTVRLAQMAAEASVRRFVFMSSIKVNGEGKQEPYTAADAPQPEDPYGISKWETEQELWRITDTSDMEVVVLRPPLVYGPGVKGNFLQLLKIVERGVPLPFARIRNRRSLIYVENLTDAIVTCMTKDNAEGRTFLVSDGEDLSTPDLIRRMAHALGRSPRLIPVPAAWLRFAARVIGRKHMAERLMGSLTIDGSDIRNDLGWSPPYTFEQGIGETAKWFRQMK